MRYYRQIVKTLGRVKDISIDSIPEEGFCVEEIYNGSSIVDAIKIYKNGKPQDFCFNGWTFPFAYNGSSSKGSDSIGGYYQYELSFDVLDPNGIIQRVNRKKMYHGAAYFIKFLYNMSCCKDINQCLDLYKYVFDIEKLKNYHDKDWAITPEISGLAIETLKFIDEFAPTLEDVKDKVFMQDLKDQLNQTYLIAQEIVAKSDSPV